MDRASVVKVFAAVLAILLMLAGFGVGRYTIDTGDATETVIVHRSDTVVVVDTVRTDVLVPSFVYIVRYDTVFIRDTVVVSVPITASVFSSDMYRMTVEGYNTRLLDVEVYPRTVTVTNDRDVVRTVRYEKVFLPFVGVSYSTFGFVGVGGGVYYKKIGVMYEWQRSVLDSRMGHRFGVLWKF